MRNVAITRFAAIAFVLSALPLCTSAAPEDAVLRALAQSFRTCNEAGEVTQVGSQFRIIMHGNVRTEFDLADLEIAQNWSDKVYLTCIAPGCVSQFLPTAGKWRQTSSINFVSLNCPGVGKKITAQLAYFYKQAGLEENEETQKEEVSGKQWQEIGRITTNFGPTVVELNQSSVRRGSISPISAETYWEQSAKIRSTWVRMTFPPYHSEGKSMSSSALHIIVACDLKKAKIDSMIAFSGPRGTGNELASSLNNSSAIWIPIAPKTPQDLVMRALC